MRKPRHEIETNTARFMHYGGVCFFAGGLVMGTIATGFLIMAEDKGPVSCASAQYGGMVCERSLDPAWLNSAETLFMAAGGLAVIGAAANVASRPTDRYLIIQHAEKVYSEQLKLVLEENEEALPLVHFELPEDEDYGEE